jgi:hypothetical protein
LSAFAAGSIIGSEFWNVGVGTPTETTKGVAFWLMIDGLPKGEHTLGFGETFGNGLVSAEPHTIAHITVV